MTEKNNIRIQKRETVVSNYLGDGSCCLSQCVQCLSGYGVTVYKKLSRETCSFLYYQFWDLGFSKVGIDHIVDVTYSQNGAT